MATIVLQAVGTAVGGALGGPIGAVIGSAIGSTAGSYIDQQLFGPGDQTVTGPRLESSQALSSREGSVVPRVYGRARIAGEIIWATQFEEVQSTQSRSQGGKGGGPKTTVKTFNYFANFAIGLCEGEIGGIGRIWVDGNLANNTKIEFRLYKGTSDQLPDSLIEAKQGTDNAPAYRGLAYIVFESFPLEDYGNRIPQIAVEIIRPIGQVEKNVTAVNFIPGATEFGYDTVTVTENINSVENRGLNNHQTLAETDFLASLDELIAICPNLQQIALVIAWFGDDLRAGDCEIRPRVETETRNIGSIDDWFVAGQTRAQAPLVSQINSAPAYGGTPSDASILRAIQAIKDRGLKVTINPFIMMDIPAGNNLPSPFGSSSQDVYPWRGRITCNPAFGELNSADGTALAESQIQNFIGTVQLTDVILGSDKILHSGVSEWSYRRMILHYIRLAELAGGVDMFILGSELRGLTSVRDTADEFPFVEALKELASDAKSVLGSSCVVTYGADWSEYFGFQPADNSGNIYYNLDKLWASPNIDAIGIDNYMPISDWRHDGDHGGNGRSGSDPKMLFSNIASEEGYDWYYATAEDRNDGARTPITDGLNKPWVYRYKDIKSWWSNQHFDRRAGAELTIASPWIPESKPIVFTEFGCPAIHNGPNQPNVFYDPKSSESALPYFSNGGRDDQAQLSYIHAHQSYWSDASPQFEEEQNPVSASYNGRMVDFAKSHLWAWDARPFPAFPDRSEVWSDSANWHTGHWLNGRLGGVRLADLIAAFLQESGLHDFDVSEVLGGFDGYIIADISSARKALEVLISLYRLSVFEDGGVLYFRSSGNDPTTLISTEDIVLKSGEPVRSSQREQETDLPCKATLVHLDPDNDFQQTDTRVRRINSVSLRQQSLIAPMVVSGEQIEPVLEGWLHERWNGRNKTSFSVSKAQTQLTVGDEVVFQDDELAQRWRIASLEEGEALLITAVATESGEARPASFRAISRSTNKQKSISAPLVLFLDLPYLDFDDTKDSNLIAATSVPWPGTLAVYSSPSEDGYSYVQSLTNTAFTGVLSGSLQSSTVTSRWDFSGELELELFFGELSSATILHVLNGANALAVRSDSGGWEIVQFQTATLSGSKKWKLSGLLRGQAGTEFEALSGAQTGADVVILNQAVIPLQNMMQQRGLQLNWMVGPVGGVLGDAEFTTQQYTAGYRGVKPYSPAHLQAHQNDVGDLEISWVRRDRLDSDDWTPSDIPMSEQQELYSVEISPETGTPTIHSVSDPKLTLSGVELANMFGIGQTEISVSIAQISAVVGPGQQTNINITINL